MEFSESGRSGEPEDQVGPLEFAHLVDWQEHLLMGTSQPTFRRHDAYAKRGRECYVLRADSEENFRSTLVDRSLQQLN